MTVQGAQGPVCMPKKETPAKRLPQSPQLCEGLRGVCAQTVWVKTWSRKNEGWGDSDRHDCQEMSLSGSLRGQAGGRRQAVAFAA